MFSWFAFLTYAVVTTATPGPNNVMSMSNGCSKGFRNSLPFNMGIWVGFSLVMLMNTAFCSILQTYIPMLKLPMLVIGAAYMLYLAWGMFQRSGDIREDHSHGSFMAGMLLQFINPKIYIYCIISMEAYILPFYSGQPITLILFALLMAAIGTLFTLCWSAFGSALRHIFSTHSTVIYRVMSLMLVYCAASLFIS